jgi:hypothetical protein
MGLVIQKANGREYVSIRESYWDPVKRKYTSRTIKNYGRLDLLLEKDPEILDKIRDQAESLKSDRKEVRKSELYHRARAELARPEGGRDFADARRILIGPCIWRRIWDKLDLSGKLRQFSEDGKCAFDFSEAVFFMTAAECLMPNTEPPLCKRRGSFPYGKDNIEPQNHCRALDLLAERRDDLVRYLDRRIGRQYPSDAVEAIGGLTPQAFEERDAGGTCLPSPKRAAKEDPTPHRSHSLIRYLAEVLRRLLQAELVAQGLEIPAADLVQALASASLTEVRLGDGTSGYVKTETEGVFEPAAKALGLGVLPHFSSVREVKKALKIRNL